MKKFVVIMISALVLFTFLMLNYLVWDKENLQKQRETDKVEQDWLRGQNRILNTTVEELEQANSKLEKEAKEHKERISDLEAQIQLFQQKYVSNLSQIEKQKEMLNLLKSLMGDDVRDTIEDWFQLINQKKYDESLNLFGENFTVLGNRYDKEAYIKLISAIDSITIAEKTKDMKIEPFTIIDNTEPEIIRAQIVVQAYILEEKKTNLPGITDGINMLEFSLSYNSTTKNWVILSINTKNSGNT